MPRLCAPSVEPSSNLSKLREANRRDAKYGGMRLDPSYRLRNHRGHNPDVGALNITILALSGCIYGVLKISAGLATLHPILRNHASDLIAMPVLLAFANLLASRSPFSYVFVRPACVALLTVVAAVQWEFVAPLYTRSTPDWLDAAAYAVGAGVYLLITTALLCPERQRRAAAACKDIAA
jgi:hypothetical protein